MLKIKLKSRDYTLEIKKQHKVNELSFGMEEHPFSKEMPNGSFRSIVKTMDKQST